MTDLNNNIDHSKAYSSAVNQIETGDTVYKEVYKAVPEEHKPAIKELWLGEDFLTPKIALSIRNLRKQFEKFGTEKQYTKLFNGYDLTGNDQEIRNEIETLNEIEATLKSRIKVMRGAITALDLKIY